MKDATMTQLKLDEYEAQLTNNVTRLPQHMWGGVIAYIMEGRRSGDFLMDLFANDFVHAAGRADAENKEALFEWAGFIFNYAPRPCWGSSDACKEWMEKGGMRGVFGPTTEHELKSDG